MSEVLNQSTSRPSNIDYKRKFGANTAVGTSFEDVWENGATHVPPTVARTMSCVSDDAADDGKATGTLTLSSAVALTKATGTIQCVSVVANTFATGTATLVSVAATDTVTINGLIYLAVSGAASEGEFDIDGDDAANAIELRDAINEDTRSGTTGDLTATAATNVVTVTTDVAGTDGNAITLTSQDAQITVSGSGTLTGGVVADTATVNGLVYTAVAGAKGDDTEFTIAGGDTAVATDLADSIDDDVRAGSLNDVTAVSSTDTVTITQTVGGTGGNSTTLASTDEAGRLNISGSVFTGGLEADTATVNGLVFTAVAGSKAGDNTKFSIDTSDTAAATDLTLSINDDVRAGVTVPTAVLVVTSSSGVVTINVEGTIGDLVDIAGTSNITASGATLGDVSTGARSITIEGLDSNWDEVSVTIALNGTTASVTTETFIRINHVFVVLTGSNLSNEGVITITATTDSTVQASIAIGAGEAQRALYSVPLGKEIHIVSMDANNVTALVGTFNIKVREFGASWRIKKQVILNARSAHIPFENHLIVPAKSDVRMEAKAASSTIDVTAGFDYSLLTP